MKQLIRQHRHRALLLMPLLLAGGLLLLPGVRWPIYGWLRGEAFYQGMPTSWWAIEANENYTLGVDHVPWCSSAWEKRSSWQRWFDQFRDCSDVTCLFEEELPLLADANGDSLGVLIELLRHDNPNIRLIACSGLERQRKSGQGKDAIPFLKPLTEDVDERVRSAASHTLFMWSTEAAAQN